MLAVTARLPRVAASRPPVILVHGAANSAGVWRYWVDGLAERGWPAYALDLRGHGASAPVDLRRVRMDEYVEDVVALVGQLGRRPVLIGWSMGGLVAMMTAARGLASACIGLAPSAPTRSADPGAWLRPGVFGPEEYDITSRDPADQPAMPDLDVEERTVALATLGQESRWARDERARGVVIESLPCPLLIATGTEDRQWPRARYAAVHLPADYVEVPGASHWGLVLSRRVLATLVPDVIGWLDRRVGDRSSSV